MAVHHHLTLFFLSVYIFSACGNEVQDPINKLQNEVEKLRADNIEMFNSMQMNMKKLENENIDLKNRVKELQLQNKNMLNNIDSIQKVENASSNALLNEKIQNTSVISSFTAYATAPQSYGSGDIVQFDGTMRNYGDNYNPNSGLYRCPVDGYYMFNIHIYAASGNFMRAEIRQAVEPLSATSAANSIDHASTSVFTFCGANDFVYVVCLENGNQMWGDSVRYSVFNGYLLSTV